MLHEVKQRYHCDEAQYLISSLVAESFLQNERYWRVFADFMLLQTAQYIVIVAYERYFAVCRTFEYKKKFTARFRCKTITATIMISSMAAAASFVDAFFSSQPSIEFFLDYVPSFYYKIFRECLTPVSSGFFMQDLNFFSSYIS